MKQIKKLSKEQREFIVEALQNPNDTGYWSNPGTSSHKLEKSVVGKLYNNKPVTPEEWTIFRSMYSLGDVIYEPSEWDSRGEKIVGGWKDKCTTLLKQLESGKLGTYFVPDSQFKRNSEYDERYYSNIVKYKFEYVNDWDNRPKCNTTVHFKPIFSNLLLELTPMEKHIQKYDVFFTARTFFKHFKRVG